jgi:hypothetical protein
MSNWLTISSCLGILPRFGRRNDDTTVKNRFNLSNSEAVPLRSAIPVRRLGSGPTGGAEIHALSSCQRMPYNSLAGRP